FILETAALNSFVACKQENCDQLLYHAGNATSFIHALTVQNSDDAQNKVNFVTEPAVFIDEFNFYHRRFGGFLNTAITGLPQRAGMWQSSGGFRSTAGGVEREVFVRDIGAFTGSTS